MLEAFPNTASSIAFRLPSNKGNPIHLFFFLMQILVSVLWGLFKYIRPGNL